MITSHMGSHSIPSNSIPSPMSRATHRLATIHDYDTQILTHIQVRSCSLALSFPLPLPLRLRLRLRLPLLTSTPPGHPSLLSSGALRGHKHLHIDTNTRIHTYTHTHTNIDIHQHTGTHISLTRLEATRILHRFNRVLETVCDSQSHLRRTHAFAMRTQLIVRTQVRLGVGVKVCSCVRVNERACVHVY